MKTVRMIVLGIVSSIMLVGCASQKPLVMTVPCVDEPVQIIEEVKKTADINEAIMFDYDKSNIREDQVVVMNKVIEAMNAYPDAILILQGYASEEGTDIYNLALSERRVNTVKATLIDSGVAAERIIEAKGNGETTLFGDILSSNRRVVVLSLR